jgi:hypothetical protein
MSKCVRRSSDQSMCYYAIVTWVRLALIIACEKCPAQTQDNMVSRYLPGISTLVGATSILVQISLNKSINRGDNTIG